ncbi:MAG: UvrD-helicase domain-containing protein [Candidatus Izemoplasmatales bacterium]|jgi:DNA helicase-2/ATP-dependent DNA helicase PcrA|nr:3'-5' exonuclease [Candidatus Izemoplasmatales bacterium]
MGNTILEQLNPQQIEAVKKVSGPIMAVAGAGSGKTRVLTNKIAYLIEEIGVPAENILAITFTNRAAEEMRTRIFSLVDLPLKGIWISTFHSLGAKILRREIGHLDYSLNFQIIDDDDVIVIVKKLMKESGYEIKHFSPKAIAGLIEKIKGEENLLEVIQPPLNIVLKELYPKYCQYLKKNNLVDFEDLLILTLRLFKEFPEVLKTYQRKFQYILVDEFQDTNDMQYELIYLLAKEHKNLFIVGDEDQSIYAFRGSNIENIRKFMRDFPDHHKVVLNQNYRSRTNILEAANSLIRKNHNRIPKDLFSELGTGEKVIHFRAQNDEEEAYYIFNKIKSLFKSGYNYKDIAILYRNNAMSRRFEDVLLHYNIPYKVIGNVSFYKRKEIKDIVAYLRLLVDPGDDHALLRIYNEPRRGIGGLTFDKIETEAKARNLKLFDVIDESLSTISDKALEKLRKLKQDLAQIRKDIEEVNLLKTYDSVLEKSGYLGMLEQEDLSIEKKLEAEKRIENLKEFKTVILEKIKDYDPGVSNYEKLINILTDMALREESDEYNENEDYVSLMTTHSAKGTEFKGVFIACLEQGLFPSSQSLFERFDIEEERRLFYVALTRAKELAVLTSARQRFMYGRLQENLDSQFIEEIDSTYLERLGLAKTKEIERTTIRHRQQKEVVVDVVPTYESKHNDLEIGDRITHKSFGNGVVVALSADKATIAFSKDHGIKTLMKDHPSIEKTR